MQSGFGRRLKGAGIIVCALVFAAALAPCGVAEANPGKRDVRTFEHRTVIGYARTQSSKGLKVANLDAMQTSLSRRGKRVSSLNHKLIRLLRKIEGHFGRKVLISSGCRSKARNRKVGGARRSFHLKCMAADIKVPGVPKRLLARFVRKLDGRGGIGTYCRNSIVHVDVGPKREWHQRCRRRKRS
jgi:uncharacterized protein YcbK (DUF882 family)